MNWTTFLTSIGAVYAAFQISVISPPSLKTAYPSGISGEMSLFGQFPYGSYVSGPVTVASSLGCTDFQTTSANTIYLIKRGSCQFTDKVLNAEQAGAKAVLIYDDLVEDPIQMTGRPSTCTIPSAFISSKDANAIITTGSVYLNLTFSLVDSTSSPSVSFVFALVPSSDSAINDILSPIQLYADAGIKTKPYYNITTCGTCTTKATNCFGDGQYCAFGGSNGAQYLTEVIRQQCIYSLSAQNTSAPYSQYFTYLKSWFNNCGMSVSNVCRSGLDQAGLSIDDLNSCYQASFQGSDPTTAKNTVLRDTMSDFKKLSPGDTPSLFLWGQEYSGELKANYVQQAICSIPYGSPKTMCTTCSPGNQTCTTDTQSPSSGTACSPGCSSILQSDGTCHSACDTPDCNYGNWACRCAANCPNSLLMNSVCDIGCNSTRCNFDNERCVGDQGTGTTFEDWKIWVIVSMAVTGIL